MARAFVGSHRTALRRIGVFVPVLAAAFLLLAAPLQAGPIFIPGKLDGDKFTPTAGSAAPCYSVRYSTAGITVEDDKARVQIEETIEGPEKAIQAVCLIPLPEGADGTDIRVTLGQPGARPTVLAMLRTSPPRRRRLCTRRWPRAPARRNCWPSAAGRPS